MNMKNIFALAVRFVTAVLLLVSFSNSYSQCTVNVTPANVKCKGDATGSATATVTGIPIAICNTPPPASVNCSGCTTTLSGNGSYILNSGQKGCIASGASFTGSVVVNGGTLVICGSVNTSALSFNSGNVYVLQGGTYSGPNLSVNPNCNFYNYGNTSVTNLTATGGKLENHGNFTVASGYNVNSQSVLINTCNFNLSTDFIVDNIFVNKGKIQVTRHSTVNSNGTVQLHPGSSWNTANLYINGKIQGDAATCSKITVASVTSSNSSASLTGKLNICDNTNGIEQIQGSWASTVITNCSCSPSVSSGSVSCTFTWKEVNAGGTVIRTLTETSASVSNLSAGNYQVSANCPGCTSSPSTSFVITEPATDKPSVQLSPTNTSVAGLCDGFIEAVTTGGVAPLQFSWQDGNTQVPREGLCAGQYILQVTDALGCTGKDTTVIGAGPDAGGCEVKVTKEDACIGNGGGTVIIKPGGQTGDNSGCVTTPQHSGLACTTECSKSITGNASATVNNGETACIPAGATFNGILAMNGGKLIVCGALNPSAINYQGGEIVITESGSALFSNINMNNAASVFKNYGSLKAASFTFNGTFENHKNTEITIDFNVNSGAKFYNSGIMNVLGSLNNNSIAGNRGTINITTDLKNNSGGNFTNECTILLQGEFHVDSDFTNKGTVQANGYTRVNSGTLDMVDGSFIQTGNLAVNSVIKGGKNMCSAIRINGITTINSSAVLSGILDICDVNGIETLNVQLPASVTTDCSCKPSGSRTEGSCTITVIHLETGEVLTATGENIDSLLAGTYSVHISCGNNCSFDTTIVIDEKKEFCPGEPCDSTRIAVISVDHVECEGHHTGTLEAVLCDTTKANDYDYMWTRNGQPVGSASELTNVPAGTYTLVIRHKETGDILFAGSETILYQPVPDGECPPFECANFNVSLVAENLPSTGASCDGTLRADVAGAVGPVTYTWKANGVTIMGESGSQFQLACSGVTYEVTAFIPLGSDSGCSDTDDETPQTDGPSNDPDCSQFSAVAGPVQPISCYGRSDGKASVVISGGSGNYKTTWIHEDGITRRDGPVQANLKKGNWTATVNDVDYKCAPINVTVTITEPAPLNPRITATNPVICNTASASVTLTVTNPNNDYNYQWSAPLESETPSVQVSGQGTYWVTVSIGNCTATSNLITITRQPNTIDISAPSGTVCPSRNITVRLSSPVSTGNVWSTTASDPDNKVNGSTSRIVTAVNPGIYTLTVNTTGCPPLQASKEITQDCGDGCDDCPNPMVCHPEPFPPVTVKNNCERFIMLNAVGTGRIKYQRYLEDLKKDFRADYINKCLDVYEELNVKYNDFGNYHHTLYYYDQAGNLIRTVPPKGVVPVSASDLDDVRNDRNDNTRNVRTEHSYTSTYQYNSMNAPVGQSIPDQDPFRSWEVQPSGSGIPSGITITDIHYFDENNGYAVGGDGTDGSLYYTSDGGNNWRKANALGVDDINDVQYIGAGIIYAVADDGIFLKSITNVSEWTTINTGSLKDLMRLHFFDDSRGFVAESDGTLWYTADGGATFKISNSLKSVLRGTLTDFSFSGNSNGIASSRVGGRGYLYHTSDGGLNWDAAESITANPLNASAIFDEENYYASGADGLLIKTTDAGESWKVVPSATTDEYSQLHFRDRNIGVALLTSGVVKTTVSGGSSWEFTLSGAASFKKMSFLDSRNGYILSNTSLYKTGDGGQSWAEIATTADYPWSSAYLMQAVNENVIYFVRRTAGSNLNQVIRYNPVTKAATHMGYGITTHTYKEFHMYTDKRGVFLTTTGELYRVNHTGNGSFNSTHLQQVSLGGQLVHDIDFVSSVRGYAVNGAGVVYVTTSGGNIWTQAGTTGSARIRHINFMNSTIGVAFGDDGSIYHTSNGGVNWTPQTTHVQPAALHTVSMASASTGFAAGDNGDVYRTTNGGRAWQKYATNSTGTLTAMDAFSASRAAAVSSTNQETYTTTGTSWLRGSVASKNSRGASYPASAALYSAGVAGNIYKSVNGGSSWAPQTSNTTETLNAIDFINELTGVAVGNNAVVVSTTNGGTNWNKLPDILPKQLNATFAVGNALYAVGNLGAFMKSTDRGRSWKAMPPAAAVNLYGVYFTSENNGFIVGAGGLIRTTPDGGNTWTTQAANSTADLKDIYINGSLGVAVGNGGVILRYNSGAGNWTTTASPTSENLNAIYYASNTLGFIAGNNGTILKSTSGNGTGWTSKRFQDSPAIDWTTHFFGSPRNLKDVYFADKYRGYVVGNNGTILRTDNAGETWEQESVTTGTQNLEAIAAKGNASVAVGGSGSFNRNVTNETSSELTSRMWYDQKGRMVLSQDAKQHNRQPAPAYTYFKYDEFDRVVEKGEISQSNPVSTAVDGNFLIYKNYLNWLRFGTRREISRTFYDKQEFYGHGHDQENLKSRIASIVFYEDNNSISFSHATHYSYDLHGNVSKLIQDNPSLAHLQQQFKVMEYKYDLISNNVNELHYQPGKADEYYYRYQYDADNRITIAETSKDGILWEKDAKYFYYLHGFLSRKELGDMKVQGLDYAHTINGWMKGVNSNTLKTNRDIGKDGSADHINQLVAQDQFGYSLAYYTNDYKTIGAFAQNQNFIAGTSGTALADPSNSLFNGNISHTVTAIGKLMPDPNSAPLAMNYRYDQLNRLTAATAYNSMDQNNNQWIDAPTNDYSMSITYDANGNITNLSRKAYTGTGQDNRMDNLQYFYEVKGSSFDRNTNRLLRVEDSGDNSIDLGDIRSGQTGLNYQYDASGQLIKDEQEEIKEILWNSYGRVKAIIRKDNSNLSDLEFAYDAAQNRIMKLEKPRTGSGLTPQDQWVYTYYVRDALGNELATYKRTFTNLSAGNFGEQFKAGEISLYGVNREGVHNYNHVIASADFTATYDGLLLVPSGMILDLQTIPDSIIHFAGLKAYELSNHLGDVLTVVSDRELPVSADQSSINAYIAQVLEAHNYYPFGMIMPHPLNLTSAEGYRFGYSGMEQDKEIKEPGNSYTTTFRLYDPRLGRWFTIEPRFDEIPGWSPYSSNFNNPVVFNDPEGDLPILAVMAIGAGVSIVADIVVQNIEIARGTRKEFSYAQLAVEAGVGAIPGLGNWGKFKALGTFTKIGIEFGVDMAKDISKQLILSSYNGDASVDFSQAIASALGNGLARQLGGKLIPKSQNPFVAQSTEVIQEAAKQAIQKTGSKGAKALDRARSEMLNPDNPGPVVELGPTTPNPQPPAPELPETKEVQDPGTGEKTQPAPARSAPRRLKPKEKKAVDDFHRLYGPDDARRKRLREKHGTKK